MPITLAGTTGITTPGMESTAMPTVGGDAVVESGSNTDGEWTKFADGTQICAHQYEASYTSGDALEFTWTLPSPFLNSSYTHSITPRGIPGNASARGNMDIYDRLTNKTSTTAQAFYRWDGGSFGSGETIESSSIATGRWK